MTITSIIDYLRCPLKQLYSVNFKTEKVKRKIYAMLSKALLENIHTCMKKHRKCNTTRIKKMVEKVENHPTSFKNFRPASSTW